uniref:Apisimin n=1 Tax=Steinernema glaseri TaxID=37863 RepID=A0A1I7Y2Q1_9BILA
MKTFSLLLLAFFVSYNMASAGLLGGLGGAVEGILGGGSKAGGAAASGVGSAVSGVESAASGVGSAVSGVGAAASGVASAGSAAASGAASAVSSLAHVVASASGIVVAGIPLSGIIAIIIALLKAVLALPLVALSVKVLPRIRFYYMSFSDGIISVINEMNEGNTS